MRAKGGSPVPSQVAPRRSALAAFAAALCFAFAFPFRSVGSESGAAGVVIEGPPVLDEVRLIAQRAALPFLRGENPFILRESAWSGEIGPGEVRLVQVQLFRRNDYHFWLAVPDRAAIVGLHLYDGKGNLLETVAHRYGTPNLASLEATPAVTGVYYLRVFLAEKSPDSRQRWTLIYGYR